MPKINCAAGNTVIYASLSSNRLYRKLGAPLGTEPGLERREGGGAEAPGPCCRRLVAKSSSIVVATPSSLFSVNFLHHTK